MRNRGLSALRGARVLLSLLFLSVAAMAQPKITAVLDVGGYSNNVAQGSVFVVKGTGLSSDGYVPAPSLPLPAILNNVITSSTAAANANTGIGYAEASAIGIPDGGTSSVHRPTHRRWWRAIRCWAMQTLAAPWMAPTSQRWRTTSTPQ